MTNPSSLNNYLYAWGDPINGYDPSGHDFSSFVGSVETTFSSAASVVIDTVKDATGLNGGDVADAFWGDAWGGAQAGGMAIADDVTFHGIGWLHDGKEAYFDEEGLNGTWTGTITNAAASVAANAIFALAGMGVTSGLSAIGELISAEGGIAEMAAAGGSDAEFAEAEAEEAETCAEGINCFTAGTDVLLGNGKEEQIQDMRVGQRVATDGGAANSADGQAAADPNSTQVRRSQYRLVTMERIEQDADGTTDTIEIQTLEPISEIRSQGEHVGSVVIVPLDTQEMGLPSNDTATITSIRRCPKIQKGSGRVVMTTVSHLSNNVFNLTLQNAQGQAETLGVTGTHRFYTTDRGWVVASELTMGEHIEGADGDLVVASRTIDAGVHEVYNMTVEADHDYYVGDLPALVHNDCQTGRTGFYRITFNNGMKYVGKGDYLRAIQSTLSRIGINGGLSAIEWEETVDDFLAFKGEAQLILEEGGIGGGTLLNIINSPGFPYL